MSTSKANATTSQVKDKKTTIWALKIYFSPYKASKYSIICRSFVSKHLAQEAMQRVARHLYKGSDIIQGSNSKYFVKFPMVIHFGIHLITGERLVSVKLNKTYWKTKKVEMKFPQVQMTSKNTIIK
ncbi:492_t:CDS:2 [Funneliformis caledonium]|uniref:492_t:CDS:1 n=1 Tax=Funneliformis caledonium TaxID=1117310 RepID=A0A9N9N8X1_9GLOM|nr:492_t:CDS:2 [Funneliformis caledonium]